MRDLAPGTSAIVAAAVMALASCGGTSDGTADANGTTRSVAEPSTSSVPGAASGSGTTPTTPSAETGGDDSVAVSEADPEDVRYISLHGLWTILKVESTFRDLYASIRLHENGAWRHRVYEGKTVTSCQDGQGCETKDLTALGDLPDDREVIAHLYETFSSQAEAEWSETILGQRARCLLQPGEENLNWEWCASETTILRDIAIGRSSDSLGPINMEKLTITVQEPEPRDFNTGDLPWNLPSCRQTPHMRTPKLPLLSSWTWQKIAHSTLKRLQSPD